MDQATKQPENRLKKKSVISRKTLNFMSLSFLPHMAQAATALTMLTALMFMLAACAQTNPTPLISADGQSSPATTTVTTSAAGSKAAAAETKASVVLISADDALKLLKDNPNAILLDVRTADEYAQGHIADSQLLPVEELANRTGELPADKATPIIVYCRSGRRSALAATQLVDLGYTQVFDLGGIQSWPYDIVK